jgi:hypothetical protein
LVRLPLTGLLYQPRMIDDDCGAVGGMKIGRGNRSTRIKPAPVPLCPPQIPHELTWARTWAAAVGSRRVTAWAMERPLLSMYVNKLLQRSSDRPSASRLIMPVMDKYGLLAVIKSRTRICQGELLTIRSVCNLGFLSNNKEVYIMSIFSRIAISTAHKVYCIGGQ